jgi:hypothetical protein
MESLFRTSEPVVLTLYTRKLCNYTMNRFHASSLKIQTPMTGYQNINRHFILHGAYYSLPVYAFSNLRKAVSGQS